MGTAKPVKKRIRGPREEKGNAKTRDFTVARGLPLRDAAYALSIHDVAKLPKASVPELAFAGRSNAGKSSAINALTGRRRLAFVSKTPGRTQLLNFFDLGGRAYLVDLPGYGYADAPHEVREHWEELVGNYIAQRESLAGVVVMMDVRHPLTPLDVQLLDWLHVADRRVHVLLTKADKLSKQAAQRVLAQVRAQAKKLHPATTVQLFSSLKNEGLAEAAAVLDRWAGTKTKAPAKGE
jgi:GTP-binding protein